VNYNPSLNTSAVIRANANSACGASQPGTLTVGVSLLCRTADGEIITENSELTAFPNPTSGKATISFNSTSKSKYLVKVTDMIGNAVFTEVVNAFEGYNTREIDLTKMSKGVYVISLSSEDFTTESIRLIVQ